MKKSIKKLLALTLTGAFLVGALTGCGKSGEDDKTMEKLYHKLNTIGISNLVMGIVTIIVGVGAGVTMIVNGARLITGKKDITF